MTFIDWIVVGIFFLAICLLAAIAKRHTRSVADFLVANRCAGRYVLSISDGVAGLGAISIMAVWETHYEAGMTPIWWGMLILPVQFGLAVTGFVIYRFRQTRALTLAQFLEMRYSRSFRVFAGILAFTSGVFIFGIYPGIGAKFFIYYCHLPETISSVFGLEISTHTALMAALLSIAVVFTLAGGQIAVILTDFVQGMFCNIVFFVVLVVLVLALDWEQVMDVVAAGPADQSPIHPMKGTALENFNVWFYMIACLGSVYSVLAFQGNAGYNSSAITPHEAQMSKLLGQWRAIAQWMSLMLMPIIAYVLMKHSDHASFATNVDSALSGVDESATRNQLTVPVVLSLWLPEGLRGAICAVVLAAFLSTHDSMLHSWASIFLQDVVLPFRKKPFGPKRHLFLLRLSVGGVAVLVFLISLLFQQTQAIMQFWGVASAIFVGGAGAVIIGGLYWDRGTTAGAWAAMLTGASASILGIVAERYWQAEYGASCPVKGQHFFALAMLFSSLAYVGCSLLQSQRFELDRMLHRGQYAIKEEQALGVNETGAHGNRSVPGIRGRLGLTVDFNFRDRIVFYSSIAWSVGWFSLFVVGTIYNLAVDVSDAAWVQYWKIHIGISLVSGAFVTIWFVIGGTLDIRRMLKLLASKKNDFADDGTVRHDEAVPVPEGVTNS